jgi:polyisoprenoid-binding protein YceI
MKPSVLAALLVAFAAPLAAQGPVKVDAARSAIRFVTKQMNVPVEGQFKRFEATVAFDPAHPEATKAEFDVDLASIDLGSDEGTTEARRKPWLDVAAFPRAHFTATAVKSLGSGRYEARGPLSIKGVSREIVAPFTLAQPAGERIVEGQFTLKRLQFRVGEGEWADTDTVADDVLVRFKFTLPAR